MEEWNNLGMSLCLCLIQGNTCAALFFNTKKHFASVINLPKTQPKSFPLKEKAYKQCYPQVCFLLHMCTLGPVCVKEGHRWQGNPEKEMRRTSSAWSKHKAAGSGVREGRDGDRVRTSAMGEGLCVFC